MRLALVILLAFALGGCSVLENKVQRGYALSTNWGIGWDHDVGTAFTTADVRMITKRRHPLLNNEVLCTEPSPDVASALAASASATASGGNGVANGSLGLNGSSAESIAELAGRSTALLGLRDGLFRACEAYANGVLGQDAYALVLAHYGELMTTLFLAQDVTGAAGADGKATAQAVLAAAAAGTPSPAPAKKDDDGNGGGKPVAAALAAPSLAPPMVLAAASAAMANPSLMAQPIPGAGGAGEPSPLELAIVNAAAAPAGGGAAHPPAAPAPAVKKKGASDDSASKGTPAQPTGVGVTAALVLGRMNEDYMDEGIMQGIVVACINESDPTRLSVRVDATTGKAAFQDNNGDSAPTSDDPNAIDPPMTDAAGNAVPIIKNPWLRRICDQITLQTLESFDEAVRGSDKIDPTAAPSAKTPSAKPTPKMANEKGKIPKLGGPVKGS